MRSRRSVSTVLKLCFFAEVVIWQVFCRVQLVSIKFVSFHNHVQVIVLSASANKLAKLKKHAATYASLIMEELDPDHRGYIEVHEDIYRNPALFASL